MKPCLSWHKDWTARLRLKRGAIPDHCPTRFIPSAHFFPIQSNRYITTGIPKLASHLCSLTIQLPSQADYDTYAYSFCVLQLAGTHTIPLAADPTTLHLFLPPRVNLPSAKPDPQGVPSGYALFRNGESQPSVSQPPRLAESAACANASRKAARPQDLLPMMNSTAWTYFDPAAVLYSPMVTITRRCH